MLHVCLFNIRYYIMLGMLNKVLQAILKTVYCRTYTKITLNSLKYLVISQNTKINRRGKS